MDFLPSADADEPAITAYADAGAAFLQSAARSLIAQATGSRAVAALRFSLHVTDALDPSALRDVILSPHYRAWQTSLGSAVRTGARHPVEKLAADLPHLLVAPALRAGMDLDVESTATDGELRFPGLPRHIQIKTGAGSISVLLSKAGDTLRLRHAGLLHEIPVEELLHGGPHLVEHARLVESEVELDASGAAVRGWLTAHNAVVSSPAHPRRDVAPSLRGAHEYQHFHAAARLVRDAWPECFAELRRQVRLVVPVTSKLMAGWTSADKLGAVFIRDIVAPDSGEADQGDPAEHAAYTADRLVHESAHTRLYHLMYGHRLFADDEGSRRLLSSPLRKDPRPAVGVMHAAFVLGRVSAFMQRAYRLTSQERLRERAERAAADFIAGRDTLVDAGVLNTAGLQLLEQVTAELPRPTASRQVMETVR